MRTSAPAVLLVLCGLSQSAVADPADAPCASPVAGEAKQIAYQAKDADRTVEIMREFIIGQLGAPVQEVKGTDNGKPSIKLYCPDGTTFAKMTLALRTARTAQISCYDDSLPSKAQP